MKKKWKFVLKVADSHSEPGNLQKFEEIFMFFSFFFVLFHFFHFFFIFLSRGTWNPGKPWKTMKNNGKPSKTKENEKKMKLQMKKKWKFGLKVADSHSEPGNLQKLEEIFIFFIFFSFFSFFFHFPFPWHLKSRKTMKNNEKQWKTIKNKGKWKKNEVANEKKMKIWTQSCRFSLRTRKSSKTRGNFHFFHFFSFSFPVAPEIQESHEKQWKTIKKRGNEKKMKLQMKKNEVANEKKWSCKWKKNEVWCQKVMNKNEKKWR